MPKKHSKKIKSITGKGTKDAGKQSKQEEMKETQQRKLYNQVFENASNQNVIDEEKWTNYEENVNETRETVNTFLKSCKLDVMVPLGKKAFIRGTLQHTNDILVSHSSNYFSMVSNFQANEILNHRNEICSQRLKDIEKEGELFRGKLDVSKNDAFSGQEIIEEYDENVENEWRKKHQENVKKQKIQEATERKSGSDEQIDELLDKYELIEEIAGELENLEDNMDYDYDTLLKLISGEAKAPETEIRVSHDKNSSIPSDSELSKENDQIFSETRITEKSITSNKSVESIKPKLKNQRKVRFSTSLEDIRIIETKVDEQASAFPPIEIKFHHSSEHFNSVIFKNVDNDIKFKHPGEIIKLLNETNVQHTKSILKDTNYKYHKCVDFQKVKSTECDDEIYESLTKFPLICGDVIERKSDENKEPMIEIVKPGTKVSRFKELRSKVK